MQYVGRRCIKCGTEKDDAEFAASAAAYLHAELNPDLPAVRAAISFYPICASALPPAAVPEEAPAAPIVLAGIGTR